MSVGQARQVLAVEDSVIMGTARAICHKDRIVEKFVVLLGLEFNI